jgi:redox-sensitive bicupin YhaK (pirin superfamily)
MPAVTADTLTLPKLPAPAPDAVQRPVRSITVGPDSFEGEGFPVRRAFAGVDVRDLDPFIHMDQMGAVDYGPFEPRGTDWHPHRGFETVTYIIDGAFQHQDSHGGGGLITNGATQWMTAGGGILHIETPPEALVVSGGLFHGVQLWVNLPAKDKMVAPRYQNLEGSLVELLASDDGGALVRLIAGDMAGHAGPGATYTPITVAHATIAPGARLLAPWEPSFNALGYVLDGAGTAGPDEATVQTGSLVAFGPGDTLRFAARGDQPLEVLLLGGRPIREPVAQYGPFVMNTRAELQQAMDDYRAGRLGTIPANGLRPYRRAR